MTSATEILSRVFGHSAFRGQQETIVRHLIEGCHALVLMPTGGGKSLCYQIPALMRSGTTLVVSPLIALMQDQVNTLQQKSVAAAYLNSTLTTQQVQSITRQLLTEQLKVLYLAPERLLHPQFLAHLDVLYERQALSLFAIDEAYCISQWGHDFRPEYRQLQLLQQRYPRVPRVALTATADAHTREDIVMLLGLSGGRTFVESFDRSNIAYALNRRFHWQRQLETFLYCRHAHHCGIIYCRTRRLVEDVAAWLQEGGWRTLPYHAGMSAERRESHQVQFLNSPDVIMVATIAFGMGIDKPDVRFVVHLDCPRSLEGYYQETGRAGRDGQTAEALMLWHPDQALLMHNQLSQQDLNTERQGIEERRLTALIDYCETLQCRRQALLSYFGERVCEALRALR
jgi:ATP-dependent DNA helicase RecQ